jgi:hypothetical protein
MPSGRIRHPKGLLASVQRFSRCGLTKSTKARWRADGVETTWRRRNAPSRIPPSPPPYCAQPGSDLGSPAECTCPPLASSVTVIAGQRAQAYRCLVYVHPKSRSTFGSLRVLRSETKGQAEDSLPGVPADVNVSGQSGFAGQPPEPPGAGIIVVRADQAAAVLGRRPRVR